MPKRPAESEAATLAWAVGEYGGLFSRDDFEALRRAGGDGFDGVFPDGRKFVARSLRGGKGYLGLHATPAQGAVAVVVDARRHAPPGFLAQRAADRQLEAAKAAETEAATLAWAEGEYGDLFSRDDFEALRRPGGDGFDGVAPNGRKFKACSLRNGKDSLGSHATEAQGAVAVVVDARRHAPPGFFAKRAASKRAVAETEAETLMRAEGEYGDLFSRDDFEALRRPGGDGFDGVAPNTGKFIARSLRTGRDYLGNHATEAQGAVAVVVDARRHAPPGFLAQRAADRQLEAAKAAETEAATLAWAEGEYGDLFSRDDFEALRRPGGDGFDGVAPNKRKFKACSLRTDHDYLGLHATEAQGAVAVVVDARRHAPPGFLAQRAAQRQARARARAAEAAQDDDRMADLLASQQSEPAAAGTPRRRARSPARGRPPAADAATTPSRWERLGLTRTHAWWVVALAVLLLASASVLTLHGPARRAVAVAVVAAAAVARPAVASAATAALAATAETAAAYPLVCFMSVLAPFLLFLWWRRPPAPGGRCYLNSPIEEKESLKALGADFDWTRKLWFVPEGEDRAPFDEYTFENRPTALQTTYLYVNYNEREEPKGHGARWDKQRKMWYVPKGKEVAPFIKYLQRDGAPPWAVAAAAKARKGKRRWRGAREVEEVPRPAEWTLRIAGIVLAIVGNPLFVVVRLPLALARLYVYTPLRHVHSLYAFLHSFLPSGVGSLVPDHLLHSPRLTLLFADYLEPPLGYRERLTPKPQESEDWRVTRQCHVAYVILGLVGLSLGGFSACMVIFSKYFDSAPLGMGTGSWLVVFFFSPLWIAAAQSIGPKQYEPSEAEKNAYAYPCPCCTCKCRFTSWWDMVWHAAVRHPAKLTTRSGAFKYVFNSGNDLTPYAVAAALVPKSAHRRWLWGRPKINKLPEPVKLNKEMPTVDELEKKGGFKINTQRDITIYTWGDKVMQPDYFSDHYGVDRNYWYDAKPLKYSKPNKVCTATHDATTDFNFVLNVAHDIGKGKGIDWLLNVLREIEDHNPQRIVIFCAQGKHRSVSAATLLKLSVYEKAVVYNLTTR